MSTNVVAHDERQRRNAQALCALLSRIGLPDICAWTIRPDAVEGQLSSAYDDGEASDRIHELAGCLDDGYPASAPLRNNGYTATVLEAVGTVDGVPVRIWTHLDAHTTTPEGVRQ